MISLARSPSLTPSVIDSFSSNVSFEYELSMNTRNNGRYFILRKFSLRNTILWFWTPAPFREFSGKIALEKPKFAIVKKPVTKGNYTGGANASSKLRASNIVGFFKVEFVKLQLCNFPDFSECKWQQNRKFQSKVLLIVSRCQSTQMDAFRFYSLLCGCII